MRLLAQQRAAVGQRARTPPPPPLPVGRLVRFLRRHGLLQRGDHEGLLEVDASRVGLRVQRRDRRGVAPRSFSPVVRQRAVVARTGEVFVEVTRTGEVFVEVTRTGEGFVVVTRTEVVHERLGTLGQELGTLGEGGRDARTGQTGIALGVVHGEIRVRHGGILKTMKWRYALVGAGGVRLCRIRHAYIEQRRAGTRVC